MSGLWDKYRKRLEEELTKVRSDVIKIRGSIGNTSMGMSGGVEWRGERYYVEDHWYFIFLAI